jgi:hypothetical protein
MTQVETNESVQVVLEAFHAVEDRDERRLLELYHPEVEFHWPASLPYGGSFRADSRTPGQGWSEVWDPLQPSEAERRIDRIPYAYYRHKLECERLIRESEVAHAILRATQFHELIEAIFTKLARWPLAPLPPRARVQPVAAAEVAARCVEVLQAEPAGRAPDFGGPEVRTLRELLELWPGRLRLLPLPIVGLALCVFANGWNTTPEHAADA